MTPAAGRWQRLAQRLPRDKADTLLLLGAAVLVLAPHFAHLPLWTSAAVCATLSWRAAITWLGKRMPPLWLLLPLSMLSMAGVYHSFHTLLGRDAGVAMLALLLAFKLLEMHARRDLFVVIFLCLFLLLTTFFYSQTMLTALSMLATLTVLLTAQLTFQYSGQVPPLTRRLRTAGHIMLLAAPLALLLFVAFPRIQGPLWGLPGDARAGRSGMSDSMAPGNVSSLAMSDEVAFRVRFLDPEPDQSQLYWRGIVLGDYDGRTWTRVPRRRGMRRDVQLSARGPAVRHQVTLEPTGKRWLFALELTEPDLDLPGYLAASSEQAEYFATTTITERLRYDAVAHLDYRIEANAAPPDLARWLALPAGFNPRALSLASTLRQPQPADSVRAVLTLFHNEKFFYTLQPPLLGRDAVDQFLFDTRAGFCEHYAGAFAVLMRAMGIPARVVTGYQGGEFNPVDGYVTVRQSDAHAWAEVWLDGQGWRRVDPTAAVAPERIAHNLARALPATPLFGLGPLLALQNDPTSWLARLRFTVAAMNNAWNQWVLDYNPDRQRNFLEELSATLFQWRSMGALALATALALLLRQRSLRRREDPLERLYRAFCRQQARHGYVRRPDEGPTAYAARLRSMPASKEKHAAMNEFLTMVGALRYGRANPATHAASLKTLHTLLLKCR